MSGRLRRIAIDTTPLRVAPYRRLFIGQAVSFVGFQVTAVAVPVQVYDISRSSFWVGILGLVGLLPLIVFGLWGGAVADAVDRRKLLLISATLTWLVTLGLLAQALLGLSSLALILTLVGVQSAAFAVASPTRNAILPRLLERELVPAANTLNFTVTNVATVAGPLIAGVIIARWGGFSAAYATDAVLFTVALYAALRLPPLPPLAGSAPTPPGLRSVVEGLRFIGTRPVLLNVVRGRHPGHGVRQPAGALPGAVRDPVRRAVGGRLAVRGGVDRCGGGRAVLGLDRAGAPAGGGADRGRLRLGDRGGGGRPGSDAVDHRGAAGGGRRGRPGVRGAPADDPAGVRAGRDARAVCRACSWWWWRAGPRLGDLRAGATAAAAGATFSWVAGGIASVVLVLLVVACVPVFLRYDARAVPSGLLPGPSLPPAADAAAVRDTATP